MADEADLQDVPLDLEESDAPPTAAPVVQGEPVRPNSTSSNSNEPSPIDKDKESASAAADSKPAHTVDSNGKKEVPQNVPQQSPSSVVTRIMQNSPGDALKQLAYLELLMADTKEEVTDRDVVDTVLNALVGGTFDLERNFMVRDFNNVKHLLKFMDHSPEKLQAEIWSMLSGILRKSRRNLLAFTEVHFIQYILDRINDCSPMIGDLLMDMMTVLAGYSITVSELQLLFTKLKAVDNEWPQCAPKLLKVLQQMPTRHGPDEFFSFPGSKQAAIALPPMCPQKWPYQLGWSFSTWLCLDPFTGVSIDQDKPFIFCFQTKTGLGYSANFLGSVLVVTANKGPGRGFQGCVNFDFEPRKWYHVCLAYVYNRWKTSMIRCYVNGQLVNTIDMPWFVSTSENFDKCYIGAGPGLHEMNAFCGEMSSIYMFNEALSTQTVEAMYQLGPAYKGQFIYENESPVQVTESTKRVIYDGKLTNSIILMYTPVACDTHICLDSSPTGNQTLFIHAPHAMLMSDVKAVITHSIHATLHSLGGIQMLFPLFHQLDCAKEETLDDDRSLCTTLFDMLCDLLENSDTLQQQMIQSRGFLVISHLLEEASPQHLSAHTVSCLTRLVNYFTRIPSAGALIRHISDHLLFNPALWIHADPQVQMMLYEYLASEYIVLVPFQTNPLRRVSTILQLVHSIKHYYWVVNPQALSGIRPRGTVKARPSEGEVIQLRGLMLAFIDRVITSSTEVLEDELQCFLNFASTVNEPENLYDVLHLLVLFMIHLASTMVPLFDAKNGLRVVFKLLSSSNEAIRIQALKLLGHFLSRSTSRRKAECMDKSNLFSLLGVKLLSTETHLTMNVYNVLSEVLVEHMAHQIVTDAHPAFESDKHIIQNPGILKVIARAICQSKPCEELDNVRRLFLDDLICLCEHNEDNRRTILQMSVWQDWLFSLTEVYPETPTDKETSTVVMELFRILLYHAIRLEFGGWRVWIDTLSILHTRVAYEDFNTHMMKAYEEYNASTQAALEGATEDGERPVGAMPKFPAFRIPEFRWSHLHQALVADILYSIEEEIRAWRSGDEQRLVDAVNSPDNATFVMNSINLVSNLSDVLITAVGGLLPLLSAATTTSGEVDVLEPGYGLSIEKSVSLLQRLLSLADVMVITSGLSLTDLETEKNMTPGTMLRQCLRIVLTMAVRNCLDCRYQTGSLSPVRQRLSARNGGGRSGDPIKSLVDGTKANLERAEAARIGLTDPISNIEDLIQQSDITRLKAVLYREADDMKQAEWVAMSVVYFVSVLMVSKYRDILEPTSTPDDSSDTPIFPPITGGQSQGQAQPPQSPVENRDRSRPEDQTSPSPSKRSNRSISPYRQSESEDEDPPTNKQDVVADIHIAQVHTSSTIAESNDIPESEDTLSDEQQEGSDQRESSETSEQSESNESGTVILNNKNQSETAQMDATGEDKLPENPSAENSQSDEATTDEDQSEDISAEKTQSEETKSDETQSEETKIDEAQSEETKTDEAQSEETKSDGAQSEETKTDEAQSEETKSDEAQSEETKTDEAQSEETKSDEAQSEETKTDEAQSEETKPDEAQSEETATGEAQSEETKTSEAQSEETKIVEAKSADKQEVKSTDDQQSTEEVKEAGAEGGDKTDKQLQPVKEGTDDAKDEENDTPSKKVSSIVMPESSVAKPAQSATLQSTTQTIPKPLKISSNYSEMQVNLSERLETVLATSSPFLREIFIDFAPYLTKTLLGSKGQELLSSGLTAIKMGTSAISLVMLLCSQEWQVSLQKHAGLAFIELVNEGRLLSHSTRDHMVKVANEAEHILNKVRAEDANKHETFHIISAEAALNTLEEELTCDRLITSARRRELAVASKLVDKVLNIVKSEDGPWSDETTRDSKFWKLDSWEDDSRRRRRMVPNPIGSTHPEAALRAAIEHGDNEDAINQAREEFHAQVKLRRQKSESEASLDDDLDGPDVDLEMSGPVALSTKCNLIAFGLAVAGTLSVTKYEIFFEWDDEDENNKKIDGKVLKYMELHGRWHMQEMRAVFARRYLLERRAIEIFLINRTSVLFSFPDYDTVRRVIGLLPPVGVGVKYGLRASRKISLASPRQLFRQSNMTQRWQKREISNFDYLMFLNTISGRSFNDLNQYPVFPWVLSNFTSDSIDLSEPSNYRDLSKPMGALNPERRKFFTERYEAWDHEQISAFHYGTHYSTSAFTLNWLIRVEPFSTLFLNLQGGKFDHANRTFSSMERAWLNCQTDTSDVKEMIPELYFLPELFLNDNRFMFGTKDDGSTVDNVVLPPWAKSPEEFVRISREALESEIVSGQIHEWIDLIFGYKQQGPEAVKATNIFYYLTYEGNVDLSVMKDPIMKEALQAQIRSFGQTPSHLLTEPHPMRGSQMGVTPKMFNPVTGEACMSLKFWSNSPIIHISANVFPQQPSPSIITILMNKHFAVNPWNNNPTPLPSQTVQKPQADQSYPLSPSPSPGAQPAPSSEQLMASLPLALDPVLNLPNTPQVQSRRSLGDNFDERIKLSSSNFATSIDNKIIFACGFWDNSFRVFHSDSGQTLQVVYGHFDVVTCVCRSEVNMMHDCFIVTGSKDCTCMIWQWLGQRQRIYSEQLSSTHNPVAQATLTGHTTPIVSVVISAELGIVISASKEGPCLIHTMNGDLLRSLNPPSNCTDPNHILVNREGYIASVYNSTIICLFSLNGRFLLFVDTKTPLRCVCMSRDGRHIITAGDGGVVSIWQSHDLAHLYSYPRMEGTVHDLALSFDHRYLLAAMSTGCVTVLNVDFTKWHHDYQRYTESRPAAVIAAASATITAAATAEASASGAANGAPEALANGAPVPTADSEVTPPNASDAPSQKEDDSQS